MYVAGSISCYLKLSSPSLSKKLKDAAYISLVKNAARKLHFNQQIFQSE